MRILIDIGHPAHVHYFKNLIKIMKSEGHQFALTARDKEMTLELLGLYDFEFTSRGRGGRSLLGKLLYIPKADFRIFCVARKFKPDIFLSFASTYAAHVSKMFGKPHITLDDTEHASLELLLYPPFSDVILTPIYFKKNLGKKQIRFNSLMELTYLHEKYFEPNSQILKDLGVEDGVNFAIVRFVSWDASHDIGQSGLSRTAKMKIVNTLLNLNIKVFISSESKLPNELEHHKFPLSVDKLHDSLFYAKLYIGEGGTTASEAAVLGTPAIYVNSLKMGYIEAEKYAGLVFQTTDQAKIISLIDQISLNSKFQETYLKRRDNFIREQIDLTSFLAWFLSAYPESYEIMTINNGFQDRFRYS